MVSQKGTTSGLATLTFGPDAEESLEQWVRSFTIAPINTKASESVEPSAVDSELFSKTYPLDMKPGLATALWDFLKLFSKEVDEKLESSSRSLRSRLVALSDVMKEEFTNFFRRHETLFSEDLWPSETSSKFLERLKMAKDRSIDLFRASRPEYLLP